MASRRTKLMSGLVAVLMLVSMLAVFVIPVSAGGADVVAAKGLVDKTALPNIADGLKSGVTEYQVNSRKGFEKWASILAGGNEMTNYTVWQTADVDMGWEPFAGIGGHADSGSTTANYSSRATFDGNGFVITGLLILKPTGSQVGFFNRTHITTIRNMGIASGLIVGGNYVGSIIGYGNKGDKLINCWSAATVAMINGSDGAGGLAGRMAGAGVEIINSYSLGLVFHSNCHAGGLAGWYNDTITVKNSYVGGDVVSGMTTTSVNVTTYPADEAYAHNAIVRGNVKGGANSVGVNNYYVKHNENGLKSLKEAHEAGIKYNNSDAVIANIDDGTAVAPSELGTLASKLNGTAGNVGEAHGYTLKYVDTAEGYPALGYYNGEELVVCRVAADDAFNVAKNEWAEKNELFKAVSDRRMGGFLGTGEAPDMNKLDTITVSNNDDLFILGLITAYNNAIANYTKNKTVTITADIDASVNTLVPSLKYNLPIAMNTFLDGGVTIDGGHHIIRNWNVYAVIAGSTPRGGFIGGIKSNTTVKDLGMIDATVTYDYYYQSGYSYPTLMIEQVYGTGSVVENCFAVGDIYLVNSKANNHNNNSAVISRTMEAAPTNDDGVPSVTMNNVWGKATVHRTYDNSVVYGRALGSTKSLFGTGRCAVMNNVFYLAEEISMGYDDNSTDDEAIQPYKNMNTSDGELAAYLNGFGGALYTVKNGDTVFGTEADATRTLTVKKVMENGTVLDTQVSYYNGGATVTIPAIAGYKLDASTLPEGAGETSFAMPAENWTLTYVAEGVDFSGVEAILEEVSAYDLDLFVDPTAIEGVKALAEAALAYKSQEQTPEVIAAANAAISTAVNANNALDVSALTLKDTYPNIPNFADYDIYKEFAPKNWAISTKEDWVKITEQKSNNFNGVTIHLMNDVDMENTDVDPLSASTNFGGTLDGHGYVFENFKMVYDVTNRPVGLVSGLSASAIIKNVGLASGQMDFVYTASGDGYGVGGIAGEANGGAQFINCWNGITINVSSASGANTNPSVGGIVGRGYNNSIIDGCYFVGTINTPTHAAGLNDWGQTDAYVRNSFAAGTLNSKGIALIRNNNNAKANYHVNSYALGYNYANGGGDAFVGALNKAPYKQDVETYSNGVLAWMLNSNYTVGTKTYYTVEDGKTVFGTAENQTVRVTLKCTGMDDEYLYVNAGKTVTLDYAENATYAVTSGAGSVVNGKELTVGTEDAVITVTVVGMNYKGLNDALAYYEDRDVTLYADNEYGALSELIATLTEKMENDSFASQGELDAYVSVLKSYELKNEYPNLPVASDVDLYEGAAGWLIKTVADLEYVGANEAKFGAGTTLYLDSDLDLSTSTFAGTKDLYANFDGCNHTLSNLPAANNMKGIFDYFRGSFVKNLKLDNMTAKGGYGRALVVAEHAGGELTIENVHVTDSTVIATGNAANAMGLLLSRTTSSGGAVVVKNCTVLNSTMTSDAAYTGDLGNVGFIVGQMHNSRRFTITDVLLEGCTMSARTGFATGIAFGCAEGACSVIMNNVAVLNNKRTNSRITWHTRGILIGTVKGGSILDLSNVIILNNQQNQADQFELVDGQAGAENFNVAFNMTTSDTVAMEGYKAKNCYIDLSGFHNSGKLNKENGNMVNVKPADYAKIAYTVNADTAATAYKWEATADEKFAMDTDGEGLPAKITFYATDAVGENTYEAVLYTNAAGKLVGLNQELLDAAIWSEEETLATKVFNGDSIVVGSIPVIHECEFGNPTHIEGTNKHLLSCIVDPGCTETQEVDCVFDQIETVDPNAAPEAAAHIRSCVCGNAQQAELCADANGDQYLRAGEDPTCTEPGEETYGCEFCGYEKTVPVSETGHNYTGNWTMDTVAPGAAQTHSRVCANECGIPETERCTYTGAWEEVPGQEARRKYCDENCGSYIDELLSVGAITIAGEAGIAGKQMTVDVLMNENPGLAGADVAITYDSDVMDLESVAAGDFELDLLFKGPATAPDANGMVTVIANFAHFGSIDEDGVLLKLTFNVKADAAPGEYDFAVSAHASDFDGNEFDFAPFTGTVEITNIIPGDINGNGYVTIADAVLMLRVAAGETDLPEGLNLDAADVITETNQGDLKVNTDDVIMVLKYLNGEIAEL